MSLLGQEQQDVLSVALYLRQYHEWSRWMLSGNGDDARVGRHGGKWCLEPHRRLFRLLTRKRIPLERAFPPELRIRFLPSLRLKTVGASLGLGAVALILGGLSHANEVLDIPMSEIYIEDSLPTKPASAFPLGEWVRIVSYVSDRDRSLWVIDSSETSWKLSALALLSVTDIEVDVVSINAAWKNIRVE